MADEGTKLKKLFKDIPTNKRQLVDKLIDNAVFMSEQLDILKETIRKNGACEEYKNGDNQFGRKKSAEVDVYNTMIKNYTAVIKQLLDLLPDGKEQADELMDFLKK